MKLYYGPGSCSLAPHIVLHETGVEFTTERVDLRAGKTASGIEMKKINPKGYVPVLELDSGDRITEASVILQYLADQNPKAKLGADAGSMERIHLQEWLNFIATELHKGIGGLWNPKLDDKAKDVMKEKVFSRLDYLNGVLEKNSYVMGSRYTIADAYLFTVLSWAPHLKLDLSRWTGITKFIERVQSRPAVQSALKAEGLLKAA